MSYNDFLSMLSGTMITTLRFHNTSCTHLDGGLPVGDDYGLSCEGKCQKQWWCLKQENDANINYPWHHANLYACRVATNTWGGIFQITCSHICAELYAQFRLFLKKEHGYHVVISKYSIVPISTNPPRCIPSASTWAPCWPRLAPRARWQTAHPQPSR